MKRPNALQLWVCVILAAILVSRLTWRDLRGSSQRTEPTRREAPAGPPKVVLVMVDGLRLLDSYKADPSKAGLHGSKNYTPRLTSELIPQGTLYPNAMTGAFNTVTTACTNTIVTGAWHPGPNRGRGAESSDDDYVDNRSFDRTLFEIARRDLRLSRNEVAFISDKLNTRLSDYSYHPLGGEELAPTVRVFPTYFNRDEPYKEETWIDPVRNSDRAVFDTILETLDNLHPRLVFASFGNVDIAGHRSTKDGKSDFQFYTRAIDLFDNLITNLWYEIQDRPAYRDNTTLILCSDHGRHADHAADSYGSHQGTCEETRNIVCFVMGPRTPGGTVVERRVFQTAFVPTIAELLDIRMPEATGQPLYESIGLVPEVDGPRYIRNMQATLDGRDVVATYRHGDGAGNSRIVVQRAVPGEPFGPPTVVTSDAWNSSSFHDLPDVVAEDGKLHVAAWHWTDANHEILYWQSDEGGSTFPDPPRVLATGKTETSRFGEISLRGFELFVSGGRSHVVVPSITQPGYGKSGSTLTHVESLRFGENARKTERDRFGSPRRIGHHRWIDVVEAADGRLLAAFGAMQIPSDSSVRPRRSTWEVFVKDLSSTAPDQPAQRLTDNNTAPHVMPALTVDEDGALTVVFAGRETGSFQLQAATGRLTERGQPLEIGASRALTKSERGAWQPDAVEIDGTVHVAYVDFDTGNGDVRYLVLRDGKVASGPTTVHRSSTLSRNPSILLDEATRTLHIVWEEATEDSFELERREIPLDAD